MYIAAIFDKRMEERIHSTEKLLYSMGEVAEMFDVNQSLIRFWEKSFDIIKPQKNKKGNRQFSSKDIENLKMIYHLVKERGMTIEGANRLMKSNPKGIERDTEIADKLQRIKAILLEIKTELNDIDGAESEIIQRQQDVVEVEVEVVTEDVVVENIVMENIVMEEIVTSEIVVEEGTPKKPIAAQQSLF